MGFMKKKNPAKSHPASKAPSKKVSEKKKGSGHVVKPKVSGGASKKAAAEPLKKEHKNKGPSSAAKSTKKVAQPVKSFHAKKGSGVVSKEAGKEKVSPQSSTVSSKGEKKMEKKDPGQKSLSLSALAKSSATASAKPHDGYKTPQDSSKVKGSGATTGKSSSGGKSLENKTKDGRSEAEFAPPALEGKGAAKGKGELKKPFDEVLEEEIKSPAIDDIPRDALGRPYCKVKDCDQIAAVEGYCRYHYLLLWKKIQVRRKILSDGKLERYVEELTSRYPDKYLEVIRKDLSSEKNFLAIISEYELNESVDNDFEDEDTQELDEVRGGFGDSDFSDDEF